MATTQVEPVPPRYDPLGTEPRQAHPDNLVSFPSVEQFLSEIFDLLDVSTRTEELMAKRNQLMSFLQMFPKGFITQVPYPENQPNQYYFRISQPPSRWP